MDSDDDSSVDLWTLHLFKKMLKKERKQNGPFFENWNETVQVLILLTER